MDERDDFHNLDISDFVCIGVAVEVFCRDDCRNGFWVYLYTYDNRDISVEIL